MDKKAAEQRVWRESLASISLGWELALPIFGGVILGRLLDRFLGTTYIFTIGLLLLGIISGYYNIAKLIQKLKRNTKKKEGKPVYIKFEDEDNYDEIEDQW